MVAIPKKPLQEVEKKVTLTLEEFHKYFEDYKSIQDQMDTHTRKLISTLGNLRPPEDILSTMDKISELQQKFVKPKEGQSFFDIIDALSKLDWNNIRQSLGTILEVAGKAVKGPQTQEQTKNE